VSFVLVARMKANEGAADEAAGAIAELAEASRREPGVELYVPCRDPEDPGSFVIFEQYRDKAAFEEHGASEHFKAIAVGRLFGLMASRERMFYETLVD
jgi:quinol monooxygenase YgiN